jgi:glutathione S-transferase
MALTLYGNRESGHSYKVALLMTMAGISYDYVAVDLKLARADRPAEFRRASRFGEVPVLVEDGRAMCQSDGILLHLAERHRCFGGEIPALIPTLREWLFWEANRIGISLPNLRLARKFLVDPPAAVTAWLEDRLRADLGRLELELGDKREFLLGRDPTIVDIACCGYLFWPEQAGITLADWPLVNAWRDRIAALPRWVHPYELMQSSTRRA